MLREEVELSEIGGHRVQEQMLDPDVDAVLDPALDVIDGAG